MDEYYNHLWEYMLQHPGLRVGQAAYVALYNFAPEITETIRSTHLDPFYTEDPKVLKAFFSRVKEHLG